MKLLILVLTGVVIIIFIVAIVNILENNNLYHYKNLLLNTGAISKIIDSIANNTDYKHKAYQRTAYLIDSFGPRIWGGESLELAIDYVNSLYTYIRFSSGLLRSSLII